MRTLMVRVARSLAIGVAALRAVVGMIRPSLPVTVARNLVWRAAVAETFGLRPLSRNWRESMVEIVNEIVFVGLMVADGTV